MPQIPQLNTASLDKYISRQPTVQEIKRQFNQISNDRLVSNSKGQRTAFISVQSSPGGGKTFLLNLLAESILKNQDVFSDTKQKIFPVLITFNGETPFGTENKIGGLCLRMLCRQVQVHETLMLFQLLLCQLSEFVWLTAPISSSP